MSFTITYVLCYLDFLILYRLWIVYNVVITSPLQHWRCWWVDRWQSDNWRDTDLNTNKWTVVSSVTNKLSVYQSQSGHGWLSQRFNRLLSSVPLGQTAADRMRSSPWSSPSPRFSTTSWIWPMAFCLIGLAPWWPGCWECEFMSSFFLQHKQKKKTFDNWGDLFTHECTSLGPMKDVIRFKSLRYPPRQYYNRELLNCHQDNYYWYEMLCLKTFGHCKHPCVCIFWLMNKIHL